MRGTVVGFLLLGGAIGCAAETERHGDPPAAAGSGGITAGPLGSGGVTAVPSGPSTPSVGAGAGGSGEVAADAGMGSGGSPGVPGTGGTGGVPSGPSTGGAGGVPGGAGAGGTGGTGGATPSSGCGASWTPADVEVEMRHDGSAVQVARRELTVNGVQRLYLLAVPTDYDSNTAYPLVFGLHGRGGDREQLRRYMNVESPAAGRALFLYPEGLLVDSTDTGWNTAGDSDDIAFVEALLAQYTAELCIDEARIFATGHSFGGCMTNAVGCHLGDRIRAIAPVAGCGPRARNSPCVGQVAALMIHSPKDTATDYSSGIAGCTTWLRANGCDEMPACGCYWVEALGAPEDACMQTAHTPYDPGVPVMVTTEDDAPPAFRASTGCEPGYTVIFADHYNRENRSSGEERWHNPPPWAGAAIWQFFSALPPVGPDAP